MRRARWIQHRGGAFNVLSSKQAGKQATTQSKR